MSGRLAGKVALITGGSRGIGAAIARAFADEGCSLVLAARREPEEAPPGEFRAADVSAEGDVRALYDFVRERHGRLDLLVNNAAVIGYGPIDELAVEDWDDVMAVNLRGAFLCTREAMRMMKPQGGGRIINIGSTSARRVREGTAAYCVSKFGLWGLTQATALEGRPHGITCGCIQPGNVRTERRANEPDPEPMIRMEDVAEIARTMAALPPDVEMLEALVLPRDQPFLGRG